MARWEPDAPGRLEAAALDLFEERGYDRTAVTDIAARAGLTKSTFFRHFANKREVLFGGDRVAAVLIEAIASVPEECSAFAAVTRACEHLGREMFTEDRRRFTVRRNAVIAATPELREREALKQLGLVVEMIAALERRGVPEPTARVAAELGSLAFRMAYEQWGVRVTGTGFDQILRRVLREVREAVAASASPCGPA